MPPDQHREAGQRHRDHGDRPGQYRTIGQERHQSPAGTGDKRAREPDEGSGEASDIAMRIENHAHRVGEHHEIGGVEGQHGEPEAESARKAQEIQQHDAEHAGDQHGGSDDRGADGAQALDEAAIDHLADDDADGRKGEPEHESQLAGTQGLDEKAWRIGEIGDDGGHRHARGQKEEARLRVRQDAAGASQQRSGLQGVHLTPGDGFPRPQGHDQQHEVEQERGDEHRPPGADQREDIAHERCDDGPEGEDRGHHCHIAGELASGEPVTDDGPRDHLTSATAQTLDQPPEQQHLDIRCHQANDAAEREYGETGHHHWSAPVFVGSRPEQELAQAEADHVYGHGHLSELDGRPERLTGEADDRQDHICGERRYGHEKTAIDDQKAPAHAIEPFPLRWNHLNDKKVRREKAIERSSDPIFSDSALASGARGNLEPLTMWRTGPWS